MNTPTDHPTNQLPPQALRHGGRILVAHESFEYGHYGELYDTWVAVGTAFFVPPVFPPTCAALYSLSSPQP